MAFRRITFNNIYRVMNGAYGAPLHTSREGLQGRSDVNSFMISARREKQL